MAENQKEIEIIYEDDEMLVINKPTGWVTTRESLKSKVESQKYIEDWIKENRPNGLWREGLVHRLDKGTSGLLVIAKTEKSLTNLQSQFKKRGVVKKYQALVSEKFPFQAEVEMPIGRSNYQFDSFTVMENGKMARTLFKLLGKYRINNRIYSLIEADLKTGRTHQIRVHLKYLKYPIVGDEQYGGERVEWLDRPFLHAYYLEVDSPETGKRLILEADLAPELKNILDNAEKI
ncbi:MAG: RluA family pseudouridine synthase [Candidatus Shapirobacteria bacterium]|nr:RluA family pseudouridine synthase [Candidatus Shapirobacteria bacterium]